MREKIFKKLVIYIMTVAILYGCNIIIPMGGMITYAAGNIKQEGEYLYEPNEDGSDTVAFSGYTGTSDVLQIPSEIAGKKVTAIYGFYASIEDANNCWEELPQVKTIIIPGTIEYIGSSYSSCENLETVIIEEGVTKIGQFAFMGCKNLVRITLPESLTSIEWWAFKDCVNLTDINIPKGVTNIEDAFENTKWLENKRKEKTLVIVNDILIDGANAKGKIVLPDTITTIGKACFFDNDKITSVVIPEGVIKIDDSAFYDCTKLEKIELPDSVVDVGDAFSGTLWLKQQKKKNKLCILNHVLVDGKQATGNISIPKEVRIIAGNAFKECKATSIKIPGTVKRICANAFHGTYIKNIQMKEGLEYIGARAFDEAHMRSINIPSTVREIGDCAFQNCESLDTVVYSAKTKNVGYYLFAACDFLENVTISEGVPYIAKGMFNNTGVYKITLPKSVKCIDEYAFNHCSATVVILNKNCEIYDNAKTIKGIVCGYKGSTALAYAKKYGNTSKITSVQGKNKSISVKWKKNDKVDGYQIQYARNSKFKDAKTVTVKDTKKNSIKVNQLKTKKNYYVRVRAYVKVSVKKKTKKMYSNWSNVKQVKTK